MEECHAAFFLLEGIECWERGQYEAARGWCEEALGRYPDNFAIRLQLAFVHLFLKEFQACRQQWLMVLNHKDVTPASRPLLLNNLARVDLMIGSPELRDEADRYSQEAVQQESWRAAFQGTRGSVLIDLGKPADGLPLVHQALQFNEDPRLKALNACYIALGESRLGNGAAALRYRDEAQQFDTDCMLLEKVDRELADTTHGTM